MDGPTRLAKNNYVVIHSLERNFWLSLFTLVLWLLVYDIYTLKRQIVGLREPAAGSMTRTEEERKAR